MVDVIIGSCPTNTAWVFVFSSALTRRALFEFYERIARTKSVRKYANMRACLTTGSSELDAYQMLHGILQVQIRFLKML